MLRLGLALALILIPTVISWRLQARLADYRREPDRSLGPFEGLRPDKYTLAGYSVLQRYWVALVITLICYGLVVGVVHP
jgi:hypothetical protein